MGKGGVTTTIGRLNYKLAATDWKSRVCNYLFIYLFIYLFNGLFYRPEAFAQTSKQTKFSLFSNFNKNLKSIHIYNFSHAHVKYGMLKHIYLKHTFYFQKVNLDIYYYYYYLI